MEDRETSRMGGEYFDVSGTQSPNYDHKQKNSAENESFRETITLSANQVIPRVLWNPKVHSLLAGADSFLLPSIYHKNSKSIVILSFVLASILLNVTSTVQCIEKSSAGSE